MSTMILDMNVNEQFQMNSNRNGNSLHLIRLSEIFEEETEIYMCKDPDPFDERHPSRTDPECELGRMLKLLFRKDHFMTRLVNDYLRDNYFTRQSIQKSSQSLNIAACRLILLIMPGLETSAVFQVRQSCDLDLEFMCCLMFVVVLLVCFVLRLGGK